MSSYQRCLREDCHRPLKGNTFRPYCSHACYRSDAYTPSAIASKLDTQDSPSLIEGRFNKGQKLEYDNHPLKKGRTVMVFHGTAEQEVEPDNVVIYFEISARSKDSNDAVTMQGKQEQIYEQLVDRFFSKGIKFSKDQKHHTRKSSYSVNPVYSYPQGRERILEGYIAKNTIEYVLVPQFEPAISLDMNVARFIKTVNVPAVGARNMSTATALSKNLRRSTEDVLTGAAIKHAMDKVWRGVRAINFTLTEVLGIEEGAFQSDADGEVVYRSQPMALRSGGGGESEEEGAPSVSAMSRGTVNLKKSVTVTILADPAPGFGRDGYREEAAK